MTVSLVSKNGIPLPLRAIPWRDLNREYWSQGKVVRPELLERTEPRELTAFEKTVDPSRCEIHELLGMTAEQYADATPAQLLAATKRMEPLTESRRAWLTRGAGVDSLDPAIEAILADPTAEAAIIDIDEPDADHDEHDAIRFGTPYELLDPITAKQIEWEQQQHANGPVTRVQLVPSAKGGVALRPNRQLLPDEFMTIARSVKRTMASAFGAITSVDDLHARVDLMRDALSNSGVTLDCESADPTEERERFLAPADPIFHSSYEYVQPVIEIAEGTEAERPCYRRSCTTFDEHRHIRIARIAHRGALRSTDELWHNRIFDVTAFELGTHGLVDPLVTEI